MVAAKHKLLASASSPKPKLTPAEKRIQAIALGSPVLRKEAAMAFVGLSHTMFELHVENGELPKPIKLTDTGRANAWLRSELETWLASRVAKRDSK